jgi:hypothetical protein
MYSYTEQSTITTIGRSAWTMARTWDLSYTAGKGPDLTATPAGRSLLRGSMKKSIHLIALADFALQQFLYFVGRRGDC